MAKAAPRSKKGDKSKKAKKKTSKKASSNGASKAKKKAKKTSKKAAAKKVAKKKTTKKKSADKRKAVLKVIQPESTSARMAVEAKASVWAISSEKTQDMRSGKLPVEEGGPPVVEVLPLVNIPAAPEIRRSSRDQYPFFRAELARDEADPTDPHSGWRVANERSRHELNSGITVDVLKGVEGRIGVELPPSFWDFSLEWSGGTLYTHQNGGFRVIPAQEVLGEVRGALCNRMMKPFLPVVDLGCGDYLALDMSKANRTGEHPVYWWYGGESKKKVADSFVQWLKKLVEAQGQPFWWSL